MNLRKWYAKRKMKRWMLNVWKAEIEDTHEDDVERLNANLQMIEKIEALKGYEATLYEFTDMLDDAYSRSYEAAEEAVRMLVES